MFYKVVRKLSPDLYTSAVFSLCEFTVRYELGKVSYPVPGTLALMAFNSLEKAREWKKDMETLVPFKKFAILKGNGETLNLGIRYLPFVTNPQEIWKFWKNVTEFPDYNEVPTKPAIVAPQGTIFVKNFTPEEIVE